MKIVCWNINKSREAYDELLRMDADVALLQETNPDSAPDTVEIGPHRLPPSDDYDRWPVVAKLSDRVTVDWLESVAIPAGRVDETRIAVSDARTLAAARVTPLGNGRLAGRPFIVCSMYARWLSPHPLAGKTAERGREAMGRISIYSDSSAHRVISDLSAFVDSTNPSAHRIVAAGDLNTILGETRLSLPARDSTVFARMEAIGLAFVGPQHPQGKRADPAPEGLPADTSNVPTYLTARQKRTMLDSGILSGNQLDYVFASRGFHDSVRVRALNDPEEWGPSDHCRILIEVQ